MPLSKDILKTLTAACQGVRATAEEEERLSPAVISVTSGKAQPLSGENPLLGPTIGRVPSILCWVTGDDVFMIWLCLLAGKVADKVVYGHYIPAQPLYICTGAVHTYVRSYKGSGCLGGFLLSFQLWWKCKTKTSKIKSGHLWRPRHCCWSHNFRSFKCISPIYFPAARHGHRGKYVCQ